MRENLLDVEYLQNEYETLYEDVKPALEKVVQGELPSGNLATLNLLFEDSINLAALAALLEKEKAKTKGFLAISAVLINAIFQIVNKLQNTPPTDQSHPLGDEDTSFVNGYHFIVGVYAAFAAEESHIATELSELYLKTHKTDKIILDQTIEKYADLLALFLTKKTDKANELMTSLLQDLHHQTTLKTPFWPVQIKLFSCIQGLNETESFAQLNQSLNEHFHQNLVDNVDNENWIQVLKLPLLGLIRMNEKL